MEKNSIREVEELRTRIHKDKVALIKLLEESDRHEVLAKVSNRLMILSIAAQNFSEYELRKTHQPWRDTSELYSHINELLLCVKEGMT